MKNVLRRLIPAIFGLATAALVIAACTNMLDVSRGVTGTGATATPAATSAVVTDDVSAVRQTLQQANEAQQQAFNQSQPQLLLDTATTAHYDELVQIDTALRNSGVTAIALVSISFDQISVRGSTADAVTTETWRATSADGSIAEDTSQNDYTLVLEGGSWKVQSDVQPSTASENLGTTSQNWSGYAATGGTFTSVSGTWIVPSVSVTTAGADATWVGIGGATSTDLIQAGTQAIVSQGAVEYEAWIETLPQPSQTVPLSVAAGDTVRVTIAQQSTDTWAIEIADTTTGRSYTTTITYQSSLSSAEWIEEAPSSGRQIVPLDEFGALEFVSGSAVVDGKTETLSAAGATAITMIDRYGAAVATPSAVGADGASFTIARA